MLARHTNTFSPRQIELPDLQRRKPDPSAHPDGGLVIANLVQAWSTLVQAQTKLTESGLLVKTPPVMCSSRRFWEL